MCKVICTLSWCQEQLQCRHAPEEVSTQAHLKWFPTMWGSSTRSLLNVTARLDFFASLIRPREIWLPLLFLFRLATSQFEWLISSSSLFEVIWQWWSDKLLLLFVKFRGVCRVVNDWVCGEGRFFTPLATALPLGYPACRIIVKQSFSIITQPWFQTKTVTMQLISMVCCHCRIELQTLWRGVSFRSF